MPRDTPFGASRIRDTRSIVHGRQQRKRSQRYLSGRSIPLLGNSSKRSRRTTLLIVVSGHGFDLDNMAGDLLQEALIRMGMTVPRQTNSRYATYVPALSLDMTRSRAFCLPTAWQGLIRINLHGREPNGIVTEAEYQSVCDEIETELLALRHRHDNAPVVKAVVQPRRLYQGPFSDELPDLSVIWNTGQIVSEVVSQRCGLIERQPDLSGGCGNHRGTGFLLAYGPGVARGRLTGRDFDIAPTISEWLGERRSSRLGWTSPETDGLEIETCRARPVKCVWLGCFRAQ